MKLIPNWKKSWRMLSVQAMAAATSIQAAWIGIPDDMKASINQSVVQWLTICLLAFGIFGRMVDQPKVKE